MVKSWLFFYNEGREVMIRFSVPTKNTAVYVDVGENDEECNQLEILVREVEYISSEYKKTGLYISKSFFFKERFVVVMSLGKKIDLEEGGFKAVMDRLSCEV
ncbi:MAG: hypothetical protein WC757_05020 [Candidatus Paceibacterota bacterium]|jgi:hypothetical protein